MVAKAPTVTVWIAQPGGRSDEAVEKLTELGVARIGGLVTTCSRAASRRRAWSGGSGSPRRRPSSPSRCGCRRSWRRRVRRGVVARGHRAQPGRRVGRAGRPGGRAPRGDAADRPRARLLGGRAASWRASAASPSPRSGRSCCAPRRRRSWPRADAPRDGVPGVTSFAVEFLGCKVRWPTPRQIRERLAADGHRETARRRHGARRHHLLRDQRGGRQVAQGGAPRGAHGASEVYVTGCAARLAGAGRRTGGQRADRARRPRQRPAAVSKAVGALGCVGRRRRAFGRTRAYVKIQDGCSFGCSYCVIPPVRGAEPQSHRGRRAAGRRAPRQPGASRARADRRQPRLLPRPGGWRRPGRPARAVAGLPGVERVRL